MNSNLTFFKACFKNEMQSTINLLAAMPNDNLSYKPHPVNRSAKEIAEHILAHVLDLKIIIENNACDEALVFDFESAADASQKLSHLWTAVEQALENVTNEQWENEMVELLVSGKSFASMPRTNMMWFFFFDIIHHRGQLSSYIRPMGGKNPAVYGYSADTI